MAFVSHSWTDLIAQYPNRYKMVHSDLSEEQVTMINDFGTTNNPDVFDADHMDNLEGRISAAFDDADAAIEDAAGTNVAEEYDASSTYAVGDYVVHSGLLYKCTTAISIAEAWDASHWARCIVTDELSAEEGFTLSDTLVAGATSLTFLDARITANSHVFPWASVWGIVPTSIVVSAGSVVIGFQAQQSNIDVEVRIS